MKDHLKKFRVYYFVGEHWSAKGETRKSTIILAKTEYEAEWIFKNQYPRNFNFGWVEELEGG